MDNIKIIKDVTLRNKNKMLGELLATVDRATAGDIAKYYAEQAQSEYEALCSPKTQGRPAQAEFMADITRCCGNYWHDELFIA